MRVLRARLHQLAREQAEAEAAAARRSQVRTVDRSRAHPHLQLPREPDQPTTAPGTRPTTWTPSWTASWTRSSPPASDADEQARLEAAGGDQGERLLPRAGPAPSWVRQSARRR